MSNPTINFRLSNYHLARGLQIIRNLEPNYQIISNSKIVKTIYFDYLAKMTLNKNINVPQEIIDEVNCLNHQKKKQKTNFKDLIKIKSELIKSQSTESNQSNQSIKSSVEDFSPPKDWKE